MEENPDILWTESFLAIIDRTSIAGSQLSSPDISERLWKSLRVYGMVGALVGAVRRRYGDDRDLRAERVAILNFKGPPAIVVGDLLSEDTTQMVFVQWNDKIQNTQAGGCQSAADTETTFWTSGRRRWLPCDSFLRAGAIRFVTFAIDRFINRLGSKMVSALSPATSPHAVPRRCIR